MKVTWEHFVPVMITVGSGLLLWIAKIMLTALVKYLTKELREEVAKLKAEKEAMQKQLDTNSRRIDFLFETLIQRNS